MVYLRDLDLLNLAESGLLLRQTEMERAYLFLVTLLEARTARIGATRGGVRLISGGSIQISLFNPGIFAFMVQIHHKCGNGVFLLRFFRLYGVFLEDKTASHISGTHCTINLNR